MFVTEVSKFQKDVSSRKRTGIESPMISEGRTVLERLRRKWNGFLNNDYAQCINGKQIEIIINNARFFIIMCRLFNGEDCLSTKRFFRI